MLGNKFVHNIDSKGRIFIPSKFRDDLGSKFVISKSLEKKPCICIYPMSDWQELSERIDKLTTKKKLLVERFLFSDSAEVELDSHGRILLPTTLREKAQLEDTVLIVGTRSKIEIWNEDNWNTENEILEEMDVIDLMDGEI